MGPTGELLLQLYTSSLLIILCISSLVLDCCRCEIVYTNDSNNNNICLKSNIHSITRYKFSRLYKKHGIHNLAVQCILKYQEKAST